MTGYVRQSAADIVPTAVVRAAPINNELNALRDAFEQTAGHKHDGTAAEGHYVPLIADADAKNKVAVDTVNNRVGVFAEVGGAAVEQVRIQDGAVVPVTDNDMDLGTSSLEFKDLYIDGTANIDSLIADTADINAGTIDNTVVGATTPAAATVTNLTVNSAATIASADINAGTIDNTVIGATTPAAATVTNLTVNSAATIASADINAGTIDGAVIGAASAQAITGTTVTATTGFVGGLTGAVTGNVTGNLTGNVTGNVTGNLTGNVTASSGSSTFNDVVINGTLNMDASSAGTITNLTSPTNAGDAATKGYVDTSIANLIDSSPGTLDTLNELAAALGDDPNFATTVTTSIATKLALAGGTMSGAIAMGTNKITGVGDPTANQDAATKKYVDDQDALKLSLTGGTMSGAIAMGTNKITGLGTPTADADATTKLYVDGILGSATSAAASAAAAATSASNAATSASNASTSASNAATSESNAASSANAAAASYDSFDDRYLGAKASAPSVDNDGNALLEGAFYWNSTSKGMFVWNGTAWEQATLTAGDFLSTSDIDTTVLGYVAPGTSGNVLTSDGTNWISAGGGGSTDVQEFSSSGTWTKPSGVSAILVELWGAGGGGGSGRLGAAGVARTGGSGGAGGAYSYQFYDASDVSSPITVTIGSGGTGGSAITTSNTNGVAGTAGGNTTFGSLLSAFGGAGGTAGSTFNTAGGGGGGRTSAGSGQNGGQPSTAGSASGFANVFGGGGGNSGSSGQASLYGGSGGGGTSTTGAGQQGGLSIYGGGGANGGFGISSTNTTSTSVTTSNNYFGSNALGGFAYYYTTAGSSFPSIIGSNVFVAASGGLLAYSSDATTFTTVSPQKGSLNGRVSWDGTNYIITTATGAYTSTDLSTWTQIATTVTGVLWRNSLYAAGKYILVGYTSPYTGSAAIAVSTDLTNWTTYSVSGSSNYWDDVQYDGTYYVVSGGGAGGPDIARSTDAATWTHVPVTGSVSAINSLAVNASEWVAATPNNSDFNINFYRSTDSGSTWTSVLSTGIQTVFYISYVNGGFVATSFNNTYYTSANGSSWSGSASTGLSVIARHAVLLGSNIVYAANTATIAKSSTSFTGWASVATSGLGANGTNGSNGLTASGGGGGGAATNDYTSGAGGAGGNGFARITSW